VKNGEVVALIGASGAG